MAKKNQAKQGEWLWTTGLVLIWCASTTMQHPLRSAGLDKIAQRHGPVLFASMLTLTAPVWILQPGSECVDVPDRHHNQAILCRYGCNMGVVMLNKALLSNFGFKYPFLLTLMHMASCSIFCTLLTGTHMVALEVCKTRAQFFKISLLSIVFCLTVVLGNISLRFIPVSFNQAISATTPVFTAVLTFLMQSKAESVMTYTTLIPVVGGIMLASRFEPSFHLVGFTACLGGTAIRALKSVLQVHSPYLPVQYLVACRG
jgi:hypothetical protein